MSNLALFDFDGTITRKDTFLVFLKYSAGTARYFLGMLILSPVLVLYKLKWIPNWRAKEIVFAYFFKGISSDEFKSKGKAFAEKVIPGLIRPSALLAIQNHLKNSDRVVIVTASSSVWIHAWSAPLGLEILATEWAEQNGLLTGKLVGKNCFGPEKKERILSSIDLKRYPEISVYGDTNGDREMLTLGTRKYYRHFLD